MATVKSISTLNLLKSLSFKYFASILPRRSGSCFYVRLSDDCFLIEISVAICQYIKWWSKSNNAKHVLLSIVEKNKDGNHYASFGPLWIEKYF